MNSREIKEHTSNLHRAALLLLHTFCLRLLDEDFTFIRNFVHRHLLLRAVYKEPDLFQDTAPSNKGNVCYEEYAVKAAYMSSSNSTPSLYPFQN